MDTAQVFATESDEPLTDFLVHVAAGWHSLSKLHLAEASQSFTVADAASRAQPAPWWVGGALARRALVRFLAGDPMAAIADATAASEASMVASNWAEHGVALAVRSVAATRLGRFADADNDIPSPILSARRADARDPFLTSMSTAIWRRAVRGDEHGVAALRAVAQQHQLYIPFAEFVAAVILHGAESALDDVLPR